MQINYRRYNSKFPSSSILPGRSTKKDFALAIIDSRVENLEFLIAEIKPNTEILVLHPNLDGISQITAALVAHPNLSSLHLIGHGSPGCLRLGNTKLDSRKLQQNISQLTPWSETLQQKDILIYGCEVAKGEAGKSFLQELQQLTKANIAASTFKVGYTAEKINWDLTTCFGKVTTPIAFSSDLQKNYRGHFAEVSFEVTPDVGIETESTEVTFNFTLDEAPPPEGTVVVLSASEPSSINRFVLGGFGEGLEFTGIDGVNENPIFFDVSENLDFSALAINIREQNASISAELFNSPEDQSLDGPSNPDIEDAANVAETVTWTISEIAPGDVPETLGTPGTIAAGASSDTIIYEECFLTGTRILTEIGYKKVEKLAIGDLVKTAEGKLEPVKWIGYQKRQPNQVHNPLRGYPILFKAGSLGKNLPERDLYTSPDHAMLVEGLLINAGALVNDVSIIKTEPTEPFCYWHVELENHSLLVAEGSTAESFYPNREDRLAYDNGEEYDQLYPYGNSKLMLYPLNYPRVSSRNKVPRYVSQKLMHIAELNYKVAVTV